MTLKGKVAVIAGAAGGAGRVVTARIAAEGANLVLLGRDEDRLNSLAADVGLKAEGYLAASADLTNKAGLDEIAARVQDKFGQVDLLINLVGGWTGGETLMEVEAGAIQNMLDQHLWSTYHLAQAFVPYMAENRYGRVLVVSSPTAIDPGPKSGPYAIGKAAQEALMLTLAAEMKGTGVTANLIQVKVIDTKHKRDKEGDPKHAGWTTPEEIASAIVYLSSEDAGLVNGERLRLYQ